MAEVAYIGDDRSDIPCIEASGLGISTSNAYIHSKQAAKYITERPAGNGAVREACELILKINKEV